MAVNNEVLAIILGGGQGTRLFPLTQQRSKPAVPIGGKYRLIDIPISNCLHAGHPPDLRADAVQFRVAQPSHLADLPARPVLRRVRRDPRRRADAGQSELVPGHGRRGAPGGAPLRAARRRLLPDPRRRPPLPHGLRRADRRARRAATPTSRSPRSRSTPTTRRRWASSASIATASIVAFEEKPKADAAGRDRPQHPAAAPTFAEHTDEQPFMASMGIYVFSREVLLDMLEREAGLDFGRELIPHALGTLPRASRTCIAATGRTSARSSRSTTPTSCSTRRGRAVQLLRSAAADLHAPALPARRRGLTDCRDPRRRSSPKAATSIAARSSDSVIGIRTHVAPGATISRSVLLGADFYEDDDGRPMACRARHRPRRRARSRDRRQERAHRRRRAARQRSAASSTPTATATTSAAASSSCPRAA